ncbi:MAG: type I-E CRISPR-associated protein Cse1/CasA [Chloroflexota bacterium]
MKHKTKNFNLLEEDWIPILRTDGTFRRVGIRTALIEAGSIRQIAASNPMDRVGILRFLLALLYWCKGSPPEDLQARPEDSFPSHWFSKLDENNDCFNLLGERKRFYQCASFRSAGSPKKLSANYLIHEIPTGTNSWHFRHSTDKVDGLCPACCATGLLRLPLFATSGGRGKPPGINAKPPVYVIPTGVSLAATLRLSWWSVSNLGTPSWEDFCHLLPQEGDVPLLVGLTWLPRRIWIDDPAMPEANCMLCGNRSTLIRQCVFEGIGSTKTGEDGPGRTWSDPHVVYVTTGKGDLTSLHAADVLGASDAAAGQWTKIMAGILPKQRVADERSSTWVVSFATVKNDKYLEAVENVIPSCCASHQIEESIENIERWRKEGLSLVRKLRPPNEKTASRKHVEFQPSVASIRPHIEHRVSAMVGALLSAGEHAWEQAADQYRPMMKAIGKSLSPGFTTEAVQRRKQISGVAPNMRPTVAPSKKTRSMKGEEK